MKPIEALAQESAEDYVEQGWFRLEYSSSGQTAKECIKAHSDGFIKGAKAASGRDSEALKIATAFVKSCIIDSDGSCYEHTGDVSSEAYDVLAKLKALSGAGKGEAE